MNEGDFWWGFGMWFVVMGIPTLIIPVATLSAIEVDGAGRYGREHFRWFKASLLFNLCGWVVMGCLWIATLSYLENAQECYQQSATQTITERFDTELASFRHQMQTLQAHVMTIRDTVTAAEDALLKWYERSDVR